MNIDVVQEPLAFILPKRELVLCLDEKELVPELPAPAPELPTEAAEEAGVEPVAAAFPEGAQEQADWAEPLQAQVPGADP